MSKLDELSEILTKNLIVLIFSVDLVCAIPIF